MKFNFYLKGETLMHEGDQNQFFYIILKGQVALLQSKDKETIKKEFENMNPNKAVRYKVIDRHIKHIQEKKKID